MFKESFKYYKSRKPQPDLKEVLDFNHIDKIDKGRINKIKLQSTLSRLFGLNLPEDWEVFEIVDNPGLIYIKNPFTKLGQRYWITRCLRDYTRKPNRLNIDAHGVVPPGSEWWSHCKIDAGAYKKLRWATLGYHHDWDTKVYTEETKTPFPTDLAKLSSYTGSLLNFTNFKAEAAIVNFYHLDSTLSGHTDHSEKNLHAPLFSFSFGNSAIFLLGGKSAEIKPTALCLDSGDIVVMSRESRLCYHGVPKILESWEDDGGDLEEVVVADSDFDGDTVGRCASGAEWREFRDYLKSARINVNVRQVLGFGQEGLSVLH